MTEKSAQGHDALQSVLLVASLQRTWLLGRRRRSVGATTVWLESHAANILALKAAAVERWLLLRQPLDAIMQLLRHATPTRLDSPLWGKHEPQAHKVCVTNAVWRARLL